MNSRAKVELDGMEIALIVQELDEGIQKALTNGNILHASLLIILSERLLQTKREFHKEWLTYIINRPQQQDLIPPNPPHPVFQRKS